MRFVINSLAFAITAIVILFSIARAQTPEQREVYVADSVMSSLVEFFKYPVVRVETVSGQYLGSAFFVNSKGYATTCAHVVDPSRKHQPLQNVQLQAFTRVSVPGDTTIESLVRKTARVIACDFRRDVAILQVELSDSAMYRSPWVAFKHFSGIREGEGVGASSFISDGDLFEKPKAFAVRGIVSTLRATDSLPAFGVRGNFIQLDLNVSPGMSGGLVYSIGDSRVIGMIIAGMFDTSGGKIQSPCTIAISAEEIVAVLDSLGIKSDIR